ncbi:MAG: MBL fold metallo-hydrolase [Gemmatimonadota bacterium]|nr:MBL fold metallo-hydrolase [Gemmatimonadota bacterium]
MTEKPRVVLFAATLFMAGCAAGGDDTPTDASAPATVGDAQFEFTEIVPGVYQARGVGDLVVGSNAAVVVNDADVLLVDSHITPAAANRLLEELRTLTDRPVRYVANTHWHFDHAHGNQVYPPDVEIISHEATRAVIASGGSISGRSYESFIGALPGRIAAMEAALDTMSDAAGRAELEETLEQQRVYYAQTQEVIPTAPNTTLSERLTLHRGDREIRFLFFGRGHTDGDVVVHLPGDGVLITGDLMTAGIPYMGDGFVEEWIDTLEHLKALEFDWIVPGHGQAYQDRGRITHVQDYFRDFLAQGRALHSAGVPAEAAAARIDMTAHAEHFEGVSGPGVSPVAVLRLFELLDADQ